MGAGEVPHLLSYFMLSANEDYCYFLNLFPSMTYELMQ
jgi:hypothetical protein